MNSFAIRKRILLLTFEKGEINELEYLTQLEKVASKEEEAEKEKEAIGIRKREIDIELMNE